MPLNLPTPDPQRDVWGQQLNDALNGLDADKLDEAQREQPGGVAGLGPDGLLYEERMPERLSESALADVYAGVLTAEAGDQQARINAYLDAPSPLGVKRLVGSFQVAGTIALPDDLHLDLTGATIIQTADNATTLAPGARTSITGGLIVGKGTDYVAGAGPTALGAKIQSPDVTFSMTRFQGHAGAGVYAFAPGLTLDTVRIQGVGATQAIPAGDAACFGIYLTAGCDAHSYANTSVSDASIGIIGSIDTTNLSLSGVRVSNIAGQHGIYLQTGAGLNASGISLSDIALNGMKVQLTSTSTADSVGMSVANVIGVNCGDTVLSLNNIVADLSTGKKFRGMAVANVSGYNCARVLYVGSVRGGTISNISGSGSTGDAFTFIDLQDVEINGIVSDGSGRLGVRCTTQTGAASQRVTFRGVKLRNPADGANNISGWQVNGMAGDWVDLTVDGLSVTSTNGLMVYGVFFATGDQESFSLRNANLSGATSNDVRLASGPRAVKEWSNVKMASAPLFFPSAGLVSGGDGLMSDYFADAAPTTGTWKRGDRVWNNAPAASGSMGWVCVAAGTPGTWKTFGAITA